ncbi:SEC-C metal-binding domain-containing protein [Streptomyces sp. ST2-7A]|uniref:YecA/YgfB family protein n=1 Tax=Streptomyces sp. ST2-7A TaxID=2907214 RepID=UPI001F42741A|nr:SEC-C metal-binding domain-containing protein [Streptomyces sp. ST2-7A]MCE7082966.1 SEC-C domain-containing protein [Streptomyces sp. ST2-7A]
MTHAPQDIVDLPRRMKHLAVDRRSYPVIATVDRGPQKVDFGSISERRKLALAAFDWCAVCGLPFGDELRWQMVFQEKPLPATVISGEAPVHEVCALYAAQVCPYLFSPRSRLGDEARKGMVRDTVVRFAGFESTHAVFAHESGLQPGVYTLHFEHRGQADEFSYRKAGEIRERFAEALAGEQELPVSNWENVLVRLFNRIDDGGEGDVVTGAALAAGAAFAKDIFKLQGLKAFRGKSYPTVAGLLLKGTEQEIREFSAASQDEAFSAVGPWVLERAGSFPVPLQRWRSRGQGTVSHSRPQVPDGPGRSVARNAPCPCGSGRKARRCHPAGSPAN